MKSKIMFFYTETPLHIGCGNDVGAVDSPVQRDSHTGFPIIPGSAVKGVLRDLQDDSSRNEVFGSASGEELSKSGDIAFCEGKLLAFPLRSMKNSFVWATCPYILGRFAERIGCEVPRFPALSDESKIYADSSVCVDGKHAVIEEYTFEVVPDTGILERVAEIFSKVECGGRVWRGSFGKRIAVFSDTMMSYFAKTACSVDQHVCIDDSTGIAKDGALFNIETVPSDSLFYSEMFELRAGAFDKLTFGGGMLQIGGDASTGLGFCKVDFFGKDCSDD